LECTESTSGSQRRFLLNLFSVSTSPRGVSVYFILECFTLSPCSDPWWNSEGRKRFLGTNFPCSGGAPAGSALAPSRGGWTRETKKATLAKGSAVLCPILWNPLEGEGLGGFEKIKENHRRVKPAREVGKSFSGTEERPLVPKLFPSSESKSL